MMIPNMLDLFAFVYRHWQARIRQTMIQNCGGKNKTETKWVMFQQWCEMHPTILCIKNYSNVFKGMSALSITDQNLEAVREGN